jgi:hypothetical protein
LGCAYVGHAAGFGFSRAADVGWPEAVARLAGERAKAETCAALLKGHGNKEQISRGQLAYGDAKSNFLTRELFDDGGPEKTWLIDTTVRAKVPLLDQVPEGVDTSAWRVAVVKLSDSITASGRLVGRAYDDQPLITLKVRIVEKPSLRNRAGCVKPKIRCRE